METRKSVGDVEFDICVQHGVWFDKGELGRLVDAFAEEGREEREAATAADRRSGRLQGAFLGIWSLFLK